MRVMLVLQGIKCSFHGTDSCNYGGHFFNIRSNSYITMNSVSFLETWEEAQKCGLDTGTVSVSAVLVCSGSTLGVYL